MKKLSKQNKKKFHKESINKTIKTYMMWNPNNVGRSFSFFENHRIQVLEWIQKPTLVLFIIIIIFIF